MVMFDRRSESTRSRSRKPWFGMIERPSLVLAAGRWCEERHMEMVVQINMFPVSARFGLHARWHDHNQ
jgi:hypothetical protein